MYYHVFITFAISIYIYYIFKLSNINMYIPSA